MRINEIAIHRYENSPRRHGSMTAYGKFHGSTKNPDIKRNNRAKYGSHHIFHANYLIDFN